MNNEPLIYCEHLAKTYHEDKVKTEVLIDVNISIARGERVAIMGSSGAGKSTLLHLLGGLDIPSKGKITLLDQELNRLDVAERAILRNQTLGFVYQFHHLLPEFTALENVGMPLLIRGLDPEEIQQKAREMLELVGLGDRAGHKPGEMSGGERQRAAVARALITRPLCVLADEPTGNLDHKNADNLYQLMMGLNQGIGSCLIVVTHEPTLARQMDRVLVLEDGKIA